jgi:hypothetical protein
MTIMTLLAQLIKPALAFLHRLPGSLIALSDSIDETRATTPALSLPGPDKQNGHRQAAYSCKYAATGPRSYTPMP